MQPQRLFDTMLEEEVGEFLEKSCELHAEWWISKVLSLPVVVDKYIWGPKFLFSDACWSLKIYPNGESKLNSEGHIGVYLCRRDNGSPRSISYSVGFKKADGSNKVLFNSDNRLFDHRVGWGLAKFLERSSLMNNESDKALAETLIITCTMKDSGHPIQPSLFGRLWNLGRCMRNTLTTKKRTDAVLKAEKGKTIAVHQATLAARSPVFDRMFFADMQESRTGEVNMEDVTEEALNVVLNYVYSAEPEGLSPNNVVEVFRVAHQYDLKELVKLCSDVMEENLSVDAVCDVIELAEVYGEEKLKKRARDYFIKNTDQIVRSEKWRAFKKENPAVVSDLLESIVIENKTRSNNEN